MRTLVTILVMAVVLFPLTANATIINIPGDYPTIQEGIDHSSDGDTVLVQPETYYENLNFNGHNVVLASLFLTSGDTAYIPATVIDGRQIGSVITFRSAEDSTAEVVGFTIQRGRDFRGGGIYCLESSPTIRNNIIAPNRSTHGGGICCVLRSCPTITNNIVAYNRGTSYGGGIYCENLSNPTISNNIISQNSGLGGGIYLNLSASPTIRENTISENSGPDGGGIYCGEHCNPTIENNIISGNSAVYHGGGILSWYGCPAITGNTIHGNSAGSFGGGIDILWDATISNNIICGNRCDYHGGGVSWYYCYSGRNLSNNTICHNWAGNEGGGCFFDHSNCEAIANTITANTAAARGGGVYCTECPSGLAITNTISWNNAAPVGPEICVGYGHDPTVSYCDIQGGWPGVGNIDADPVFVGPYNHDFHLRWHSPCIDAGLPDSLDPDGTRSDMGAFYFNQDVDGIVEVYPSGEPIVIPPEGGDLIYDGWVFNFLGQAGRADIWTYAFVPEMGRYGPIDLYENVRIPADSIGMNEITKHVPGAAPAGDYVFVAYVGDYPSTITDSSCFYFAKTGSIADGIADWQTLKGWFAGGLASTGSGLPTHYALSQNYPNPFNATTIINYQVPVDSHVRLEVYNTLGQKVATLLDSRQQAGYRSVVWDASTVSSGLYLYKLTAGDFTETRRMMLVK